VTRARRAFEANDLATLDRQQLRKLCHALLIAEGAAVTDFRTRVDFDEFTASTPALWRRRRSLVRIWFRALSQQDLDDVGVFIESAGFDEALFLTTTHVDVSLTAPHGVHIISPGDTAMRIISSPLAGWDSGGPSVAIDRLDLLLRLEGAKVVDRIGIEWLPAVAFNELPPALIESSIEPQDLLERKCFRLLTATFLFDGERFGEAARGKRLPDAVIRWPDGSECSALVDCKAAASGYMMEADHLLRFVEYWEKLGPGLENEGFPLQYLVIVSSHFPGVPGDRHPFVGRETEIRERTGLQLCYVKASDLAWVAASVEGAEAPHASRRVFDWHSVLGHGLVSTEHLLAMIAGTSG